MRQQCFLIRTDGILQHTLRNFPDQPCGRCIGAGFLLEKVQHGLRKTTAVSGKVAHIGAKGMGQPVRKVGIA